MISVMTVKDRLPQVSTFRLCNRVLGQQTTCVPCMRSNRQPMQLANGRSHVITWSQVEMCTGMGMTGIPRIPRDSRGCGRLVCGISAGMEVNAAGIPRVWKKIARDFRGFNLLTSKLLAETVHQPISQKIYCLTGKADRRHAKDCQRWFVMCSAFQLQAHHQRDVFLSHGGPWMTEEICSARILLMELSFYMD